MRYLAPYLGAALGLACSGGEAKQAEALGTSREFVSTETSACIADHPSEQPFDVGEASATSGGTGSTVESPTVESLAAECREASGTGCDGDLISKEAARCIAQNEHFEAGLDAWSIGLAYLHSYHRLAWGVDNLLVDHGADGYSGQSLTLDALSGRVLGRTGWSAMP